MSLTSAPWWTIARAAAAVTDLIAERAPAKDLWHLIVLQTVDAYTREKRIHGASEAARVFARHHSRPAMSAWMPR